MKHAESRYSQHKHKQWNDDIFHIIDENGLKGTVVNRVLLSLNGESL